MPSNVFAPEFEQAGTAGRSPRSRWSRALDVLFANVDAAMPAPDPDRLVHVARLSRDRAHAVEARLSGAGLTPVVRQDGPEDGAHLVVLVPSRHAATAAAAVEQL